MSDNEIDSTLLDNQCTPLFLTKTTVVAGGHSTAHGSTEWTHGGGQPAAEQVDKPASRERQAWSDGATVGCIQRSYQHGISPAGSGG